MKTIDVEFEVLRDTMINLYEMCLAEGNEETGEFRILEPKDVFIITRGLVPNKYEYKSFKDFCLNAKLMKLDNRNV